MIWCLDFIILSMLVLLALSAVSVKGLLSAAVLLSGYSFLMALLWTEMGAVDVAFTEAAVGAGVSTVLLIAVVFHSRRLLHPRKRYRRITKLFSLVAVLIVGAVLFYATLDFPAWSDPASPASLHLSPHYLRETLRETSVPNVVTSVLADYRGYDTLFETAVIFCAGIAVTAQLRRPGRRKNPGRTRERIPAEAHKSLLVQFVSRQIVPLIQLFALYVLAHGHDSPGGGFQGGVILGASFILYGLAYDIQTVKNRFSEKWTLLLGAFGVLVYAGTGVLSLLLGGNYLDYGALSRILPGVSPVEAHSLGILIVEVGVAMAVMAIMYSIYLNVASRGYQDQGL